MGIGLGGRQRECSVSTGFVEELEDAEQTSPVGLRQEQAAQPEGIHSVSPAALHQPWGGGHVECDDYLLTACM